MDWNTAMQLKKRMFWEEATETIRTCPENYCVAARVKKDGQYHWVTDIDAALRPQLYFVQAAIREYEHGSTGQALADAIAEQVRLPRRKNPCSVAN